MLPELGQVLLALALLVAAAQALLPLAGAHRGDARLMAVARPASYAQLVLDLERSLAPSWLCLHSNAQAHACTRAGRRIINDVLISGHLGPSVVLKPKGILCC